LAFRIRGGAQKKRKALDEPTHIPDVMGKVEIKDTDPEVVKTLFGIDNIDVEEMINTLSMAQLVALDTVVDKYEKTLGCDTAIKAIAEFYPDTKNLQECMGTAYKKSHF
jgi:hypothetical protein